MSAELRDKYRKDLEHAESELVALEADRDELDSKIADLKRTIIHLSALTGADVGREMVANMGLSYICEFALKVAGSPVSIPRLKRLIADLGYNIDAHKNALASIHTTVNRLVESEKVNAIRQRDGKTVYAWNRKVKKK